MKKDTGFGDVMATALQGYYRPILACFALAAFVVWATGASVMDILLLRFFSSWAIWTVLMLDVSFAAVVVLASLRVTTVWPEQPANKRDGG